MTFLDDFSRSAARGDGLYRAHNYSSVSAQSRRKKEISQFLCRVLLPIAMWWISGRACDRRFKRTPARLTFKGARTHDLHIVQKAAPTEHEAIPPARQVPAASGFP